MRSGPHHIATKGATDGQALIYDRSVDEYAPGDAVRTIASSDGSVTVVSTDPQHVNLTIPASSDAYREVLMASGTSFPADPLESSGGGDWIYGKAS